VAVSEHLGNNGRAVRSRTLERSEGERPVYVQIAAEVRRRIDEGVYAAEEALPSQRQLSEEFGVTVMTLRQALERLRREQLLVTRPGLGTFVAPRRFSYSMGPLRSLAQEVAAQGLELVTRVVGLHEVVPDAAVASALDLDDGAPAYLLERLRSVDGEPVVFQQSHLPKGIGRALDADELASASLYELMATRLGVEVERARERVYPTILRGRQARLLRRRSGSPAVRSERLSLTGSARPVLFDQAFMPGDRLVITADRRRSDVSIRYELIPSPTDDGRRSDSPSRRRR
jgi:GntR family transcriptional regulator